MRECQRLLPDEKFIYLADKANMPYGNKTAEQIKCAACDCCDALFSLNCKAVAVACNTATVTAIDDIRELHPNRVVVGLEPAIKPCFRELGRRGYALALVTDATFRSDKLARLIDTCEGRVRVVSRGELAKLIEDNTANIDAIERDVYEILAPYRDAEAIVLGCSHYAYIEPIIRRFYDGKIKIYDGARGEAERLKYCLQISDLLTKTRGEGGVRFYSTVGHTRKQSK